MCLTPSVIRDKRKVPQGHTMEVPCGYCPECMSRRRREWTFRNLNQLRSSGFSQFVTLTYDDDHIPRNDLGWGTLVKKDLQDFLKRYRKISQSDLKYFAVGEYGDKTQRPHYHLLMYGMDQNKYYKHVDQAWSFRGTPIGSPYYAPVNEATIMYVAKYHLKGKVKDRHADHFEIAPEFTLISKGLGADYITPKIVNYVHQNASKIIYTNNGERIKLPRYYENKIQTSLTETLGEDQFRSWKIKVSAELEQYAQEKQIQFPSEQKRVEYIKHQFDRMNKTILLKSLV